ncbi:hypothetical protein BDN67DRAFT_1015715 [Paxillus ammoniavirescens]|nr:hypothetical protein BDN67DRAFT_1015715 [Paxillus ammoniavirescens]
MPQDARKVRFALEAMVYHIPAVNEGTLVPSPPKCLRKICRAHSNQQSSGEGTSIDLHATKPHFPPISQLIVPAQPKPRKNKDKQGLQGRWVSCSSWGACNPSSTQDRWKSGGHCLNQNLSTILLPSEPKASHSYIDSLQSTPGPSNPISAPDVFNEPEDITMDYMDVDPSPSQINPLAPKPDFQPGSSKKHSLDVLALQSPSGRAMYRHILESQMPMILGKSGLACKQTYAWIWSLRIISQIGYQATPHPRKIDYKEGFDDPLNRAMEDYQQMFLAACKHRGSVLEWQKRLVAELEILQVERKKYII